MANYNVKATDEQDKVLAYKLDIFNADAPSPILTIDEYVQYLFNIQVTSFGPLQVFESEVVTDAYEKADPATQDEVDVLLGVTKK